MKRIVTAIVVWCLLGATGCGKSDPAGGSGGTARKLRFAIIPKALDLTVFNYARVGAERAAAELGNVEILWNGPPSADQLRQKEILESYITQRVDGIGISTLNADFLTETINRAVDAGIPVVTWDSDAPNSKRLAFYGVDDLAAGRILGEQAVKLLGGNGKVAIITSYGATNLERRLAGLREVLAAHPGMQIVETYDVKEDTLRCAEIIATGTARYPDLRAWISVGGWPVFTRNGLAAVDPSKTKVISFDTNPPAPDVLKEGKVQVLLGQKYFGWGSETVKLLANIKAGKMPPATIIDSGIDIVTKDNVDAYIEQWKKLEAGK